MVTKRILLASAGLVHPPYRGRTLLAETLSKLPDMSFDSVSSLPEAIGRGLTSYDAAVLYYHYPNETLAPDDLRRFDEFVRNGGGVLAVHSATASYKPSRDYFAILGGRFIGHGPVQAMEVRPAHSREPVFAGIDTFTVHDELYLHELQPDIDVHFQAQHEGKEQPVVWTRTHGGGRVCYLCPGHRSASMEHESVREIVRRGLGWVTKLSV